MATRRKDTAPRRDETGPFLPHTHTTHLKATSQTHNPTAPRKSIPTSLKPTLRTSANDVFKQRIMKKPTSTDTPHKPPQKTHVWTNPSRRPRDKTPSQSQKRHVSINPSRDKTPMPELKRRVSTNPSIRDKTPSRKTQVSTNPPISRDKTPLPARKTHISTSATPSPRFFPISGKTTTCQKMVPGKNPKALDKDVGERNSLHRTPISTTLNTTSNICSKEQVIETTTSLTKGQITDTFQENVDKPNKHQDVPEVEIQPEDQESCTIVENEEQIVQVVSTDENDVVGLVPDDQEKSFDVVQIEVENDDKDENDDDEDVTFVANETSRVLEQQEASIDIKTQESEEKPYIEEKFEENGVHEIDNTKSISKSAADDYPEDEDEEKEVEVTEKEEKEEVFSGKRDEVASESEAIIKPVETKGQVVVEEQKQESGNAAQKQGGPRGKKDSVVSNDVIEETANKLREQRKNRVRALAGAFETVISLQ